MRDQQMAGALGMRGDVAVGAGYDNQVKRPESGSVDRELSKLQEALGSLEHALTIHVNRIQPVMLTSPGTGQGAHPSAPDAAVCDVASSVRDSRRRLEDLTAALAMVTSRVDL